MSLRAYSCLTLSSLPAFGTFFSALTLSPSPALITPTVAPCVLPAQSSQPLFLTPAHTPAILSSHFPPSRSWNLIASAARLSNPNEASLSQILPNWYQTIFSELNFSPLSPHSFSLQGSLTSLSLPSLPHRHLRSTQVCHLRALVLILYFSLLTVPDLCWWPISPPHHAVSISPFLFLCCPGPFPLLIKKKKRPLIWHAPLRLQALYCWISPALTFKWSHSAPSISLPHYIPPFSLSVFSTPSALMTSLLLLTPIFLSSSIANSPYTTISFNFPSHPVWLMPLTHFFCCLLKDHLPTA